MRANFALTTAVSVLVALLPLQAAAQDFARDRDPNAAVSVLQRPRPEYDPLGKRLGGFDLNAALALQVASTDNVFAEEVNSDDDVIASLAPSLSLASHWSRHSLSAGAGANSAAHQDFDQNDITDAYLRADGRLDIYRASEIGAGASVNQTHELRSDPDSPNAIAEPVAYKRNNAHVYARHAFNRVRLTGRLQRDSYDYDDTPLSGGGILDQDFRDHDETVESLRVEVAVNPRLALVGEAAANQREYDVATRDSDGRYGAVGVSFDLTQLVRGEVLVTQYTQDYNDPTIGTVEGTGFSGRVEWFPSQLTTVNVDASKSVEDSAFFGASYVLTQAGARVDHEVLRNVIVSGGVRMQNREYEGLARSDERVVADVGATYLVNRRMRINVGFAHDENDSNFAGEDFEENRLSAGVSFHL